MSESDDLTIDCLIPARGGSKVVPKKNIKILGKLPLIVYSIKVAKKSKYIRRVIVTTDDQEIANISKNYGAEILYLRPKDISTGKSIDIDFFKYHIKYLNENHLDVPDLIVHLRPTTPFRDVSVIDDAIEFFKKDKRATSLRSANIANVTPYKIFKKDGMYMKPFLSSNLADEFYNLPRQTFEEAYMPNGYVDIVQPDIFKSSNILHGDKILLYKTQETIDIDTIEDFYFAEQMLKKHKYKI
ncbi:MAG: cytidylyltransferase [Rhodospirillaceae bacterium]|jgi:N-acylneuraminate cytidylyltransferase|nr:cytidylyltransferase [Rhodospirillaceae bacterium]|tara:strand:- start:2702 stop:3427 length:726 start_codon:yes stop_codon:yes gene_type:complete